MKRSPQDEEDAGNLDFEETAIRNSPVGYLWFINNGENARRKALLQADDRFAVEISPDNRKVFVRLL